jgi:hypothetical protein
MLVRLCLLTYPIADNRQLRDLFRNRTGNHRRNQAGLLFKSGGFALFKCVQF